MVLRSPGGKTMCEAALRAASDFRLVQRKSDSILGKIGKFSCRKEPI
jgi:hypothetical protein